MLRLVTLIRIIANRTRHIDQLVEGRVADDLLLITGLFLLFCHDSRGLLVLLGSLLIGPSRGIVIIILFVVHLNDFL